MLYKRNKLAHFKTFVIFDTIYLVVIYNYAYLDEYRETLYILCRINVDWEKGKDTRQEEMTDEPPRSDPFKNILLYK